MSLEKQFDELKNTLCSEGKLDDKKLFTFATAQSLPGGEWGFVGIGVRNDKLIIFDAKMSNTIGDVGEIRYEIPIKEIENFKYSEFVLKRYMKFDWQGAPVYLKNFQTGSGIPEEIKAGRG